MTVEERKEMLALMQEAIQPINDRLNTVDSRLDKMDSRFDKVDSRFDKVDSRLDKLEQGQTHLELIVENQVDRAIKTIAEGHSILNRKLDEKLALEKRVDTVEHKVAAIEYKLKQA